MTDDELLAELRSARDEFDPAPPTLRAVALAAGEWDGAALDAGVLVERDLVALRSIDTRGSGAQQLLFDVAGCEVTVELSTSANDEVEASVSVMPRVDVITVLAPGVAERRLVLDADGAVMFSPQALLFSIAIAGANGSFGRTPLISTIR